MITLEELNILAKELDLDKFAGLSLGMKIDDISFKYMNGEFHIEEDSSKYFRMLSYGACFITIEEVKNALLNCLEKNKEWIKMQRMKRIAEL